MTEVKPLVKYGWLRAVLLTLTYLVFIILSNIAMLKFVGQFDLGKQEAGDTNMRAGIFLLIRVSVSLLVTILTVYFFRRRIDKRSLLSLGLTFKNNLSNAAAGFFLALVLLGVGSLLLIAIKALQWKNIHFDLWQLLTGLVVMLIVAFSEELIFRGYILDNLMQSMNKWLALVYAALLFAIFHLSNPGMNILALINIFLAGLLLGINYIFTKNLWFGILFHFAWNFYQGPILGYKVSGISLQSLFEQELSGNHLLTGGQFGFEGSLIAGLLTLFTVLALGWMYERKLLMING
jgi:membrane protease YdiL (CAAX protease family)